MPSSHLPTVLVLDNDAPLRSLLRAALGTHCQLRLCAGGDSATEELRRGGVDVLLLDLHLGGGESGDGLASAWAKEGILPPFLMLTGMVEDPRLSAVATLPGYGGLVGKPFSVADLLHRVLAMAGTSQEQRT